MKYKVFSMLYKEARQYDDFDMYVAERGWQEWMDNYEDAKDIADTLRFIYDIARMDIRQIRDYVGASQVSFIDLYEIPRRTYQGWEHGDAKDYIKKIFSYSIYMDKRYGGNDNAD